jgi:hypothetical protein
MQFGQQQPRRIHIAPGDVGMNIDGACHNDMTGDVHVLIRLAAGRRGDDATISEPDVANGVPTGRRIDDMSSA